MSFNGVVDILQQNLDEDTAADGRLTTLAENGVNQGAADAAYPETDGEADEPKISKFVHEDVDARTRRPDHFRKRFLASMYAMNRSENVGSSRRR